MTMPLVTRLSRLGSRAVGATIGSDDLRQRHLATLTLIDQGGVTQQRLAALLMLDPSNVVAVLNDLEDRELIVRRRDPADRRRHIVDLTDAGRAALKVVEAQLATIEDGLLSVLSAEERATLHSLLERVVGPEVALSELSDDECE